jgi:DNA-binding FadR family transcriptional regulator
LAQAIKESTKQQRSREDNAAERLERYVRLLEAIKAMDTNDEAKALKAMLAISKGLKMK